MRAAAHTHKINYANVKIMLIRSTEWAPPSYTGWRCCTYLPGSKLNTLCQPALYNGQCVCCGRVAEGWCVPIDWLLAIFFLFCHYRAFLSHSSILFLTFLSFVQKVMYELLPRFAPHKNSSVIGKRTAAECGTAIMSSSFNAFNDAAISSAFATLNMTADILPRWQACSSTTAADAHTNIPYL